jgi:hypothetical protein
MGGRLLLVRVLPPGTPRPPVAEPGVLRVMVGLAPGPGTVEVELRLLVGDFMTLAVDD